MAMRRWLRIGGSAGFLLAMNAPSSIAEIRESPGQFWINAAPRTQNVQDPFRPKARSVTRRARSLAESRPSNSAIGSKPKTKPAFVVSVFGDAFGASVARGLTDAYARLPNVLVDDRTSDDSELTLKDSAAWAAALDAARAQTGRIDAAVIMLGGDDLEPLADEHGHREEPGSAAWRQLYGDRVEKLAATFRDNHVATIWVGLPVVRDGDEAKIFADLNAILRERAPKGGATFVDSWEAFADENGQYSAAGPDVNGQDAKLRRADGWDFTRAGARKLASFVEGDLKREQDRIASSKQLASVPIDNQSAFDQALQIDVNAQILREAGLPPGASRSDTIVADPVVVKPQAGPILALTAPPFAAGGVLAKVDRMPGTAFGGLAETALVQGKALNAKPGRTDDFSWPRR